MSQTKQGNEFKSVYFSLSIWQSCGKEKKSPKWNLLLQDEQNQVWRENNSTQAEYNETIWIFNFFYYSFFLFLRFSS